MRRLKLFFIIAFTPVSLALFAQELTCYVTINSTQIQGTNKEIFNTLRDAITDFMNNTAWTNHVFEVNERIECNFLFNLKKEVSSGRYEATLTVQSRRPVYASSYNSVMLNYIDENITFDYTEYDPLEFSETSHLNNLTSILAFYAYMILGLDYDSFSPNGGDPFFQMAEKIVDNAQSSPDPGWKAFEARGRDNRYWLVNNMRDDGYQPLRDFNYTYHRQGLDVLDNSIERGRMVIKEAIIELEKFYKDKPDPFIHYFNVLIDSKGDEIVDIFSEAPQMDRQRIHTIMTSVDPANAGKYAPLQEQ